MTKFSATGLFALFVAITVALPVAAQDSYRIKQGDVLRIDVLEDDQADGTALVLPDGTISVPLAGSVRAGGRTLAQVQADIATQLAPNFATPPTVAVSVSSLATPVAALATGPVVTPTIRVYMMGEAAKPGKYEVDPGSTLLQVLAESGGLSPFAATKRLQLRRGAAIYSINYRALERGATANPIVMQDGDVIMVPQRGLFE